MIVCHQFSHCEDPRGDVIDKLAEEARERNVRIHARWHVDAARAQLVTDLDPLITTALSTRSEFHAAVRPDLTGWPRSARGLPPISLKINQAVMVLQLRTGYWPSLGTETFIRSMAVPFRCPKCDEQVSTEHGGAVRHVIRCGKLDGRPLQDWLWSSDPTQLRGVIAEALTSLPRDRATGTHRAAAPPEARLTASPPLPHD